MGVILFLLSWWGINYIDFALMRVSNLAPVDTLVIGKPVQSYSWAVDPTIKVCADTKVPLFRIQQAVHYWEDLGYDFDGIYIDHQPNCMNPKFGEIIITLPEPGFSPDHIAATRVYTLKKTNEIIKTKIFILPKHARKSRVLEHEIGHALGWKHYPQRYHIMHPKWELSGHNSSGLKKID